MLVVHGIWAYGALQVWAEDSGLAPAGPAAPRTAAAGGAPAPVRRPAGRTGGRTRGRAGRRPGGRPAAQGGRRQLTLRLPSTAGGPLASPELLIEPADGRRRHPRRTPAVAGRLARSRARLRARQPPRRCSRRSPSWHRGTSWSAARSATSPRSPGSPTTWRPAAGCCPCSPRRTGVTLPAGGRCCPRPTRGTPASSPPRCRPRAAPWPARGGRIQELADTGLADTGLPQTGLADTGLADTGLADTGLPSTGLAGARLADPGRAPRQARCSRTCSTPSRTRRRAPGCLVPCCPRARAVPLPVPR